MVQSLFLSKLGSQSVKDDNEKYLQTHAGSTPHIHSVIRVRKALKTDSDDKISTSDKELLSTLDFPDTTLEQILEGLRILHDLEVDAGTREEYLTAARKRWPEATALKT